MSASDRPHGRKRCTAWTALQHGSTLVAALGGFVLLFALNTAPVPDGFVSFGVVALASGICGTAVGWLAKRFVSAGA